MQHTGLDLCPLCNIPVLPFYKEEFLFCNKCMGISRSSRYWLGPDAERSRYEHHNNDINDPGYQQFVSPIARAIFQDFKPMHQGLDFGAGTGPVISKLLKDQGYNIRQYDPFFHNYPELLKKKYNYIVCCEVMEHFYYPAKEFARLKQMLLPGGALYCMTHIYSPETKFDTWYYKNDPTHVFIYQKETLEWIRSNFGFTSLSIDGRLIKFGI